MNKSNLVEVRYLGTRAIKKDNVADTGVSWFGQDDVQEVPENAALLLCQYPTVWQMASIPAIERPEEPEEVDELEVAAAAELEIALNELAALSDEDRAIVAELVELVDITPVTEDEHGFANPPEPDPIVSVEELVESYSYLNKDTDFTQHNKPKVDAVRALFPEREVTALAMKEAWDKFSAVE